MTLTREYKELVATRAKRDPKFRDALFTEALNLFITGELGTAKLVLRDYIHATIGFRKLAAKTGINAKSLLRMFSVKGNPSSKNLSLVFKTLQDETGTKMQVNMAA